MEERKRLVFPGPQPRSPMFNTVEVSISEGTRLGWKWKQAKNLKKMNRVSGALFSTRGVGSKPKFGISELM